MTICHNPGEFGQLLFLSPVLWMQAYMHGLENSAGVSAIIFLLANTLDAG